MPDSLLHHEELINRKMETPLRARDIPVHPLALSYTGWDLDELLKATIISMGEDRLAVIKLILNHPYARIEIGNDSFSLVIAATTLKHPYRDFLFSYSEKNGMEVAFLKGDASNIAIGGPSARLHSIEEVIIFTGLPEERLRQFAYETPEKESPVIQFWHQHNPYDRLTDFFFRNVAIAANNLAVSQLSKI